MNKNKFAKFGIRILSVFIPVKSWRKSFRNKMLKKETVAHSNVPLKQYKQDNFKINILDNREKCYFLYTNNTSNIGDLNSCPENYFYFNVKAEKKDIVTFFNYKEKIYDKLIVGGGIHPWLYMDSDFYQRIKGNRNVAWGIGMQTGDVFPADFLEKFMLIGIREFNYPFIDNEKVFYVPCSSCMSTVFDRKYSVKNEIIFYGHYMQKDDIKSMAKFPMLTNYSSNLGEVIKFLASGDIVCTNSYHGAYWATLLGKKVIYKGYARKWGNFKFKPLYVENFSNLNQYRQKLHSYSEALEDCRKCNIDFYLRVVDRLNW